MEYECCGSFGHDADWADFISCSDDKNKYPDMTIELGKKDDIIDSESAVNDGWIDLTVVKFEKDYVEEFLSELIGETIIIQETEFKR